MQLEDTDKRLGKFIAAAVLYLVWATVQGAIQSQAPVHTFISQGPAAIIVGAHVHVGTLGWVTLSLAALIYYLVPRITGKPLAAPGLINWLFWIFIIAFTIEAVLMIVAGISAGNAFAAGTVGPQLDAIMAPFMIPVALLSIVCGIIWILFAVQILVSLSRK